MTNNSDINAVDSWINGVKPRRDTEQRLRFAYKLVTILRTHEKPEVVQAWLIGINPELGDRTALRILREDSLDVAGRSLLGAAKAFASGS